VTLYAESSAVLSWLFREASAPSVQRALAAADVVVTSELTLVECDRAILRRRAFGGLGPSAAAALQRDLADAASRWAVEAIGPAVIVRARAPFADDQLRSMDAIHLATAVVLRAGPGALDVLSLDERVRANAAALGFRVVPD
jgi:predicted nucleic acid-binding protein